jgi:bifunctional non-homologous end joining protein LigD
VFFPRTGFTKGDLLAYYWNVALLLLPYLRDRPLTLKRLPNGVGTKGWIEKNLRKDAPEWIPRCHVPNFLGGGEWNDFPMINDESHLLYVVNLGCIDLHPLHARCDDPSAPDFVFVDIDPAESAPFADVRVVAQHVHAAFEALGLPSYPKSTGATGIHIYVPIERSVSFAAVRSFVERLARAIRDADPGRVTLEWAVSERTGKVFIDANMNRRGQNAAVVWSVRPQPTATVAVPVTWDEVEAGFEPTDWDITNVHARIAEAGDPMAPLLTERTDVREAMEKLGVEPDPPEKNQRREP